MILFQSSRGTYSFLLADLPSWETDNDQKSERGFETIDACVVRCFFSCRSRQWCASFHCIYSLS